MSEEAPPRGWKMYTDAEGNVVFEANVVFEVKGKRIDAREENGMIQLGAVAPGSVVVHYSPFPYRDYDWYQVFRRWDDEREKRWERDNPDGTYIPRPTKEQWLERCAEFYDYLFSLRG